MDATTPDDMGLCDYGSEGWGFESLRACCEILCCATGFGSWASAPLGCDWADCNPIADLGHGQVYASGAPHVEFKPQPTALGGLRIAHSARSAWTPGGVTFHGGG